MKKLLFFITLLLLAFPTISSAHTELTSSNPVEGQVITENLQKVNLTFEGEIEPLSKMELIKDGTTISFDDLSVENSQMNGYLDNPLPNGSYELSYNVVAHDGHPVPGKLSFSVQVKQAEKKIDTSSSSSKVVKVSNATDNEKKTETPKNENHTSSSLYIIISVVVILFIFIAVAIRKKK